MLAKFYKDDPVKANRNIALCMVTLNPSERVVVPEGTKGVVTYSYPSHDRIVVMFDSGLGFSINPDWVDIDSGRFLEFG